jgi:hypothetical protein
LTNLSGCMLGVDLVRKYRYPRYGAISNLKGSPGKEEKGDSPPDFTVGANNCPAINLQYPCSGI